MDGILRNLYSVIWIRIGPYISAQSGSLGSALTAIPSRLSVKGVIVLSRVLSRTPSAHIFGSIYTSFFSTVHRSAMRASRRRRRWKGVLTLLSCSGFGLNPRSVRSVEGISLLLVAIIRTGIEGNIQRSHSKTFVGYDYYCGTDPVLIPVYPPCTCTTPTIGDNSGAAGHRDTTVRGRLPPPLEWSNMLQN